MKRSFWPPKKGGSSPPRYAPLRRFRLPLSLALFLTLSQGALFARTDPLRQRLDRALDQVVSQGDAVLLYSPSDGRVPYVYNPRGALRLRYPPGSLAKIWTAALILEGRGGTEARPLRRIPCHGRYYVKRVSPEERRIYNIQEGEGGREYLSCSLRDGHGNPDLREAIIHSCNSYFLKSVEKDPLRFLREMAEFWRLDAITDAQLEEGEELPLYVRGEVTPLVAQTSAVGEGGRIKVSLLKVAQTFGALYGGTPLLRPVQGTLSPAARPVVQYGLPVSRNTRLFLLSAMGEVPRSGTLRNLRITNPRVRISGGKTGTGTHEGKRYSTHGWNVILFRLDHVPYVLVSFAWNGSGSDEARAISQAVLNAL